MKSVPRSLAQQKRRKNEFNQERDMWKRLALGLPCPDGKRRSPRFSIRS